MHRNTLHPVDGARARLEMLLVVAATTLAGLLASVLLLHAGLRSMWLRYPVSVGIAYVVFLLLAKLWAGGWIEPISDVADLFDVSDPSPHPGTCAQVAGVHESPLPSFDGLPVPDFDEAVVLVALAAAAFSVLVACG